MRLLNSTALELSEFVGDDIPPYAILSHTWGNGEVTYQDIQQRNHATKDGFRKIQFARSQALQDGLEWVWVDTCCIDKSSSAELSEAINSMYRWYAESAVCYAYLCDMPPLDPHLNKKKFEEARWFTRGWCLQELIAPKYLEFYARDWTELGTKRSLGSVISKITAIPDNVLQNLHPVSLCPIAQRMSWASTRSTTRIEDMAYCLLGLFDVNMPLLYGEGKKSFQRLQEEIIKREVDYTIFYSNVSLMLCTGFLCDSPRCFPVSGFPLECGGSCSYSDLRTLHQYSATYGDLRPPELTARGLRITFWAKDRKPRSASFDETLVWMGVTDGKTGARLCINLHRKEVSEGWPFKYSRVHGTDGVLVADCTDFRVEEAYLPTSSDLCIRRPPPANKYFTVSLKCTKDQRLAILDTYPCWPVGQLEENVCSFLIPSGYPGYFAILVGTKLGELEDRIVVVAHLLETFMGTIEVTGYIQEWCSSIPMEDYIREYYGPDRAISLLPSTGNYAMAAFKSIRGRPGLQVSILSFTEEKERSLRLR